jgi:hypothetical protein
MHVQKTFDHDYGLSWWTSVDDKMFCNYRIFINKRMGGIKVM